MAPEFAPLVSLVAAALLIVVLHPVAVRIGLVDMPNARKSHQSPTPLVGGIAMFGGLVIGFFLCQDGVVPLTQREIYSFFGAGALLVGVGLIDDLVELSPLVRLVAQVIATLIMIFGAGVVLDDLGSMTLSGRTLHLGFLSIPFTIFATLGIINALNMCDGLDGLSGSLTFSSLSGLILVAYTWGSPSDTALLPILGTAIAAFLLFNVRLFGRKRASVFMGDAGSMFLGFALTWYAISLSQGDTRVLQPSAALWFLLVPIFDAVAMMLRRILKGRSPFSADREHLHHIFTYAGNTVNETVIVMTGLASCGVFVGLASIYFRVPDIYVAGAFLLAGIAYFRMIMRAWKNLRFLNTSFSRRTNLVDRRQADAGSHGGPDRRSGNDRRKKAAPAARPASVDRPEPPARDAGPVEMRTPPEPRRTAGQQTG